MMETAYQVTNYLIWGMIAYKLLDFFFEHA